MTPAAGTKATTFKLPSTSGEDVSLASLRGQRVVLYFYPKDDTPGCTREACAFRDNLARVTSAGASIYGVSKDSIEAHNKFRAKYQLTFPLLTDAGNEVAKSYGAFGKKMMYGRAVEGTIRSTFLIGPDGKIEKVWSPVKVDGHAEAVLAAIKGGGEDKPEPRPMNPKPKVSKPAPRPKATQAKEQAAVKPKPSPAKAMTSGKKSR